MSEARPRASGPAIPEHVASNRAHPAYFAEFWRLTVKLDGVRLAYVVEAKAGPRGYVRRIPIGPDGKIGGTLRKPATEQVSGHVELSWMEPGE